MAAQFEPPAPTRLDRVQPATSGRLLVVPALVGCLVSLTLGIYGRLHSPTGVAVDIVGFSSPATVKAWLATVAVLFAVVQVGSALVMYGKVPRVTAPSWIGGLHRWSGRIAFILTVPVVVHCLYALGFQTFNARVLVHSICGCLFFGVFSVKMLALTRRGIPGWALPLLGGLAFALLVVIWFTSAFWFFSIFGFRR
jgi:small-conductance mechanosensitive channel